MLELRKYRKEMKRRSVVEKSKIIYRRKREIMNRLGEEKREN